MTETNAKRFYDLFSGLDRVHGKYTVAPGAKPNEKGKVEGAASTELTPPTVDLFEHHLAGTYGLGVVPIRDDATAGFGAIDVDVYPLDAEKLAREVAKMKLPLIPCRTKSSGVHLYLFLKEEVPAELVRSKLMEWAVALGYGGVEIFPKQTQLASERDCGNWINLPYHGGERSLRYALDPSGKRLGVMAFLDVAEKHRLTREQLQATELPANPVFDDLLKDAPPCLQSLAKLGFPQGTRNNALFSLAVYLRMRYEDTWATHLDTLNQKFMDPPLTSQEVQQIVKSVNKKKYFYKCNDQPIVSVCNKQICLTRRFGIGTGDDDPGVVFGTMVKLETSPPTWIWDVDGARIELTTEDLMNQGRFQRRCLEELTKWPNSLKPAKWVALVREKLAKAEVVQVPVDATPDGQLMVYLQRFCLSQAQARNKDELLMGKPFTDEETGRTYFCSSDFLKYLEQHRVRGVNEKKLYSWLRKAAHLDHHFFLLKKRGINCWSVPRYEEQAEPFDPAEPQRTEF